ncbi:MAG: TolB family protein, partial [Gemmatimonadaceae bacterium]
VFVVPAQGGTAVQITQEVGGAFAPAWTHDGSSITYQAVGADQQIVRISLSTHVGVVLASDSLGIATPSCNGQFCLAVTDPAGDAGDLVSFSEVQPSQPRVVMVRTNHEREPALLVGQP